MANILIEKTSGLFGLVGAIAGPLKQSPHLVYLGVTMVLNIQPIVRGFTSFGGPYHTGNPSWLIVNGFFALAHVLASLYIVSKITKKSEDNSSDDEYNNMQESENKSKSFMEAIEDALAPSPDKPPTPKPVPDSKLYRLMMYDSLFAFYLVVLLSWMLVVLPRGISVLLSWPFFSSQLYWSIICGYLYIVVGVVVFAYFLFSKLQR